MRVLLGLCLFIAIGFSAAATFGAYFVNWAQYRAAPYTYQASDLEGIISRVDEIYYGFLFFCPPAGTSPMPYWAVPPYGNCNDATEYQILSVEPKDATYIPQITSYKSINSKLKLLLSIGGWNFPSAYFSKLAASSANRQKFVTSVMTWLSQYNADGIDLDWEYPGSPSRSDPVEISCTDFRTVQDNGGSSADTQNIVALVKDIRAAFGSKYLLTVASQAAKQNEDNMNIVGITPYVDMLHIMSYDYTVSDIPDAEGSVMSPNCPLYEPAAGSPLNVNQTVEEYLSAGIPASKMMIGLSFYGHSWYNPSLVNTNNWKKFGNPGLIQGECCGPFVSTYGAKFGKGCNMCGTMMYSEILNGKPDTFYDNGTQSMIGYWNSAGADGWTEKGTWISYNEETSVTAITNYAKSKGLAGLFGFDTSMDSVQAGAFTYDLMNTIANTLGGH